MKNLALKLLASYKKRSVTVWQSGPFVLYSNCKFHPTCSEYASQAIEKHGLFKGLGKGLWRVLRCNPLSKGGVDLP